MNDSRTTGPRHTRGGRPIYDTGKVQIGIRSGEQATQRTQRGLSVDAERLQMALVRYGTADGNAMHPKHWIKRDRVADAQIAANRERYDEAFEDAELTPHSLRAAPLRRARVLYLNNGMVARIGRWIMRLMGAKV